MIWRAALFLAVLLAAGTPAAGTPAAGTPAAGSEPWLDPFHADASALLESARELRGADADALMVYQDVEYSLGGDHRAIYRRRWVYRILTRAGLERWSVSEARWSPWYQQRPEIRARVIHPDGRVRWLDATAYSELAEPAGAGADPSARRILRAELAGLAVGAVVEEEIVRQDFRPLSSAGVTVREYLALPVPIHRGRLVLQAPQSLRYAVDLVPGLEPRREDLGGRLRVTFDYRDLPAADARPEPNLPADLPRHPQVTFSTGESWNRVAGAWSREMTTRIVRDRADGLFAGLPPRESQAQTERIAELLAGLRSRLRSTPGGRRSGDPLTTSRIGAGLRKILERGSGDSSDLANVLVALLRAEDVPAFPALVRAGPGQDVADDLPGLGLFDRALVYVPAGRPIWIDPWDRFSRMGELPSAAQGRRALIASTTTRGLTTTPETRSADNRTVSRIEVHLAAEGPARFVEQSEYRGRPERDQRRLVASLDRDSRRRGYTDYVRSAYRAEALGEIEESDPFDLSAPFRLELEALRALRAFSEGGEAALAIELVNLLAPLPAELLAEPAGGPRRSDFDFEPFLNEWHYAIFLPPGMTLRSLPREWSRPIGSGLLTRSFRREVDAVYALFRFDSGPRRLTPEQLAAYRAAVQELLQEETLVLWFDRR